MPTLLFKLGSIKGKDGISIAMRHNKRTSTNTDKPNIVSNRTCLNYCIGEDRTAEATATHAKVQMLKSGIEKYRKNGVMAVEAILSLPINRHGQDTKSFFEDCYRWVQQSFAGELLSFDVHLDESAPHAHAMILPLIDGRMQGSKLKGNRQNLMRLKNSFYDEVGKYHGLARGDKKQLTQIERGAVEQLVLSRLKQDPAMLSDVWSCIRDAIRNDPLPFAAMLSITAPANPNKTESLVSMMIAKNRGGSNNSIGNYV